MESPKRTKQDYINLLNETVEYYKYHPRSMTKGWGTYYNKRTKAKCAVGRCLNLDNYKEDWERKIVTILDEFFGLENNLQEQYKGYDIKFWDLLQYLHDNDLYWSGNELNEYGKEEESRISDWIGINIK